MEFKASWVQGYSGSDIFFIGDSTIAYICGRHVKFINVKTGDENVYSGLEADEEAISTLAVHRSDSVFAISETSPRPRVHVISFPDFGHVSTLKDGALLDYHALAFGPTDAFIATVSTHPDFRVTIWNYSSGVQLCFVNLNPAHNFHPSTQISFSPSNPSQLCLTTEEDLLLWNIERSDDKYLLGL